jgi:hypothetical protein
MYRHFSCYYSLTNPQLHSISIVLGMRSHLEMLENIQAGMRKLVIYKPFSIKAWTSVDFDIHRGPGTNPQGTEGHGCRH